MSQKTLTQETTLKIVSAGALHRPLAKCVELFWESYPRVKVKMFAAGSRECARRVMEGLPFDVLALADPGIFAELLAPDFVSEYFVFATDQIVLAYERLSRHSETINAQNWMDVLLKEEVNYARSDHNLDPCGYRTLLVWKLAELFYGRPGLFEQLNARCQPANIYPKSLDAAVSLLEGRVDYAFLYSSVAGQLGLRQVALPVQINLSSPSYAQYYNSVYVAVEGKFPHSPTIIKGAPIEFAVGLAKKAPFYAQAFVDLLTGRQGQEILEECGLIPC
ncbi:MAG: extracellular solute-binding protein [Bacillota bacterium]